MQRVCARELQSIQLAAVIWSVAAADLDGQSLRPNRPRFAGCRVELQGSHLGTGEGPRLKWPTLVAGGSKPATNRWLQRSYRRVTRCTVPLLDGCAFGRSSPRLMEPLATAVLDRVQEFGPQEAWTMHWDAWNSVDQKSIILGLVIQQS